MAQALTIKAQRSGSQHILLAFLVCLLLCTPAFAQNENSDLNATPITEITDQALTDLETPDPQMQALADERTALTLELEQYSKTLAILNRRGLGTGNTNSGTAVSNLAMEIVRIKRRLIAITEQEVAILQQRIADAKAAEEAAKRYGLPGEERNTTVHSIEEEQAMVARLLKLIAKYYSDLEQALALLPSEEDMARLEAARRDAANLAKIPFSASKVRLSPAESNTALAQITGRLTGQGVKQSRRDIAPICSIRTRLFGKIISSENRSLKPVGNKHYVTRVRLQPGTTEFHVRGKKWIVKLPQDISAADYLITLYLPGLSNAEFHVMSIEGLLSQELPYVPAWLPKELNILPPAL